MNDTQLELFEVEQLSFDFCYQYTIKNPNDETSDEFIDKEDR